MTKKEQTQNSSDSKGNKSSSTVPSKSKTKWTKERMINAKPSPMPKVE